MDFLFAKVSRERVTPVCADAVDADRFEPGPFSGIVGGPRDHSTPGSVNRLDEGLVNELAFLPEIGCVCGCKERRDIDWISDKENPRLDSWRELMEGGNNSMIERVHGASIISIGKAVYHSRDKRFDPQLLDFDVHSTSLRDCFKHVLERWDRNAGAQLECTKSLVGQRAYRAPGKRRSRVSWKARVVMYHYDAVARRVDVELDRVCSRVERCLEGRQRVFGVSVSNAAVSNDFRYCHSGSRER